MLQNPGIDGVGPSAMSVHRSRPEWQRSPNVKPGSRQQSVELARQKAVRRYVPEASDLDSSRLLHSPFIAHCYLIFFLSGAAALIYEISWSRQLGLLFGHTVHAAAVVLASYFAGMAVGHLVAARWSSRVSPLLGYGIAR
ncbi:MAG: hypothetical protein ACC645_24790 [Pirellulales bacterium]